ncbi:TetR/AcrR family transcriptional regulator [Streptomyces bauhiniae]|uniref:TetR/AcrR family transcriptional regulator n=2 Tax=Streptomyces bauhiniae TaxID=2340725 RepID=A0A4Z1DBR5_9ACTN|nr:TetR/AcrR family transcriptional regulator [Streptomyces bauhiniae]
MESNDERGTMTRDSAEGARPYHHGDLRAALVQEAMHLLAAEGLAGFSVAKLARALGVSSASPYRHFPDRESLLAAVAARIADELTERLRAAADRAGADPAARLAAAIGAYTRYVIEHRVGLDIVFLDGLQQAKYVDLHEHTRRLTDLQLDLAVDACAGAAYDDVFDLVDQVLALAHGYAALHNFGAYAQERRSAEEIERKAVAAARRLIDGQRSAG